MNTAKSFVFSVQICKLTIRQTYVECLGWWKQMAEALILDSKYFRSNKFTILGFLKDKVAKRVEGWDGKLISNSRIEILIKSVG